MWKTNTVLLLLALVGTSAYGQTFKTPDLRLEARGDFKQTYEDGEKIDDHSGFKCHVVDVKLEGEIGNHFQYKYRQRLNNINKDNTFLEATDWLYLQYNITPRLDVKFGKWVVLTGGWEFDPAPIDVFQLGEFASTFPCYQWGVDVGWHPSANHYIIGQVTESPFRKGYKQATGEDDDMYGYSLIWYGTMGAYRSCWSVNMMEYEPGKFINYILLGNRLVTDHFDGYVDIANRAARGRSFLLGDCSIVGQLTWKPSPKVSCFARGSYEVNHSESRADVCVHDGTELWKAGGGVFFYPLGNEKVRVHAQYSYVWGKNTNENGALKDNQHIIDMGLSWKMDIL